MKKKHSGGKVGGAHLENPLQRERVKAGISQETVASALSAKLVICFRQVLYLPYAKERRGNRDEYAAATGRSLACDLLGTIPLPCQLPLGDARNRSSCFSFRIWENRLLSLSKMSGYHGTRVHGFL